MSKMHIRAGAVYDVVSHEEMKRDGDMTRELIRASQYPLRGVKHIRRFVKGGTNAVDLGECPGGFVQTVMSATGPISASGNVALFLGPAQDFVLGQTPMLALAGSIGNNITFTLSKGQCVVRSQERFCVAHLTGTSTITNIVVAIIEVPSEREGELWL